MSVSLAILLLLLIPAFPSNAYSKIWPKTNILRKYGGDSKDLEWVEGSAHAVPKRHVGDDDALQFLLVLCGNDETFLTATATAIESLATMCRAGEALNLWLVVDDEAKVGLEGRLKQIVIAFDGIVSISIMWRTIDESYANARISWVSAGASNKGLVCGAARISRSTVELLDESSVHRVIYIDPDIVVLRDPRELWQLFDKFNETQIISAAVESGLKGNGWYGSRKAGEMQDKSFPSHQGINDGVLLMDIARIVNEKVIQQWEELAAGAQFKIAEQDLLNQFFSEHPTRLSVLPYWWNYRSDFADEGLFPAETSGERIGIMHGNRHLFRQKYLSPWKAAYQLFEKLPQHSKAAVHPMQAADRTGSMWRSRGFSTLAEQMNVLIFLCRPLPTDACHKMYSADRLAVTNTYVAVKSLLVSATSEVDISVHLYYIEAPCSVKRVLRDPFQKLEELALKLGMTFSIRWRPLNQRSRTYQSQASMCPMSRFDREIFDELNAKGAKRALVLDDSVILLRSLREVWQQFLSFDSIQALGLGLSPGNHDIGAPSRPGTACNERTSKAGLRPSGVGIEVGVMLVDIKKYGAILPALQLIGHELEVHDHRYIDEAVLSVFVQQNRDRLFVLPYFYNYLPSHYHQGLYPLDTDKERIAILNTGRDCESMLHKGQHNPFHFASKFVRIYPLYDDEADCGLRICDLQPHPEHQTLEGGTRERLVTRSSGRGQRRTFPHLFPARGR